MISRPTASAWSRCVALLISLTAFAGAHAQAAGPGTLQIGGATSFAVVNGVGMFTVPVSRLYGSAGAVSASYSTVDGTALAGRDYLATSGAVSWADGDAADKLVRISIVNQPPFDGIRNLTLVLAQPTGGATLGPASALLSVYNTALTPPTIAIASPPANVALTVGDALPLAASVADPSSLVTKVQFFLGGQLIGESAAPGPFRVDAVAPAAGAYELKALAIDSQGRQTSSVQTLTVVADDPANPAPPPAASLTDLDGRALAAGAPVTLSASALDADGQPLAQLDLYVDGALADSLQPLANARRGAIPRLRGPTTNAAGAAVSSSSLFNLKFSMPGSNKLVNMVMVGITKAGRSKLSAPLTVQAVAASADRAPRVSLAGGLNGAHLPIGASVHVPVSASDPDGGVPSAFGRGPAPRAFDVSSVIAKMEYYLNGLKVKDSKQAPFGFDFTPPAAGTYLLSAIATDESGLAAVSDPIAVEAVSSTVVSVAAAGSGTAVEGGRKAKVSFTRAGGDTSQDLSVSYRMKGNATNGVDFRTTDGQPLSGTAVIPAGAARLKLKIVAVRDGASEGRERLKLQLLPSADGAYEIGAANSAKVLLLDEP